MVENQNAVAPKTLPDWHGEEDESDYDDEDGDFEFGTENQSKPASRQAPKKAAAKPTAPAIAKVTTEASPAKTKDSLVEKESSSETGKVAAEK